MLYGNLQEMLYQLPNGKTIYLTVEQFLDLTEQDIQDLVASGHGETPINPFFGSVIRKGPIEVSFEDEESDDIGLDFDVEGDDPDTHGPIDLNNIPDESSLD